MEEKIKELLANEDFRKKLAECRLPEAVKKLFAEHGVEIDEAKIKELLGGELADDVIGKVAGGYHIFGIPGKTV